MMPAVRALNITEVMDRLAAIEGVAETELMPSADPIIFPALHVFDPGHETDVTTAPGVTRYDLTLTVEGYVEGEGGAAAHADLMTLYTETVAALITDPPLGGLAETIDEGAMRVAVAPLASARRLGFSLEINITFPASRSNPAEPA